MYWVYILVCRDGSFYTGWTTDRDQRIMQHNAGKGAKYTRSRRPVTLVYSEKCLSQGAAMRREHEIKLLSREKKLELVLAIHLDSRHGLVYGI